MAPPTLPPIPELLRALATARIAPEELARYVARAAPAGDAAWIDAPEPEACVRAAREAATRAAPLAGIPFAVKDNIDVAGRATTAGCPAFAYRPCEDAHAVGRLLAAGAWVAGKTNLDQFATGLAGTRSPHGAVPNVFHADYLSGGSSSGSASVVARGIVPFALGTDTAGSGRVPAGFNNIVGLKPTRGLVSTRGVVPACRSLDCVSILALTAADAYTVLEAMAGEDPRDPFSRARPATPPPFAARRFGVPAPLDFLGDRQQERGFAEALSKLRALGVETIEVPFAPLREAAALLYEGPWIAERYAAVGEFIAAHPNEVDPAVRKVVERGAHYSAVEAFRAQYRLAALRGELAPMWAAIDALVVPTVPTIYTRAALEADPIARNAHLGLYTNFVNLLDLCALAVPAGFRADGLPHGITLVGPAWSDAGLAAFGDRWQRACDLPLGATGQRIGEAEPAIVAPQAPVVRLAVVGAHLRGQPLNAELTARGARFAGEARTCARYRLYALAGTRPPKPGLVRAPDGRGAPIAVELWDLSPAAFGELVSEIPPPLGVGSVELEDGRWVKGFLCEAHALQAALDISEFGGWRRYLEARHPSLAATKGAEP